jgi:hypothetical protein
MMTLKEIFEDADRQYMNIVILQAKLNETSVSDFSLSQIVKLRTRQAYLRGQYEMCLLATGLSTTLSSLRERYADVIRNLKITEFQSTTLFNISSFKGLLDSQERHSYLEGAESVLSKWINNY